MRITGLDEKEPKGSVNQLKLVVNNMKLETHLPENDKPILIYDKPIFKARRFDPY